MIARWRAACLAGLAASSFVAFSDTARAQCVTVGATVICSGTTAGGATGFGTGAETGLTINVTPGATVSGTNDGISVGDANTVNNSGTISGTTFNGITSVNAITVNNAASGTINGNTGINAPVGTIANAGLITGLRGVDVGSGSITNSGTISTTGVFNIGINTSSTTVVNSGTITGSGPFANAITVTNGTTLITNTGTMTVSGSNSTGLLANTNSIVTFNNSGVVSANSATGIAVLAAPTSAVTLNNNGTLVGGIGVSTNGGSVVNNAGVIVGTSGTAMASAGGDTFNFLPGSRVQGEILLAGATQINFRSGDISSFTFFGCRCGGFGIVESNSPVTVSGGAPYVIVGNRLAILDPTAIGMSDRNLLDFTRQLSSLLAGRAGEAGAVAPGSGASAYASADRFAAAVNEAFAAVTPSAASASAVPNAAVVDRSSGVAVWSKAFGGARRQEADGPMLAATSTAFGGVLGIDKQVTGATRLGAFLGAGRGRLSVDLGSQTVDTDYIFGGAYGRTDWTSSFLDYALTLGHAANTSTRLVANNIAVGGLQTANASYGGWFVSPELAYGVRIPFGTEATLTPAIRLRYLAGFLDGYAETGSAQALSVSRRTIHNLEQRAELSLSRANAFGSGLVRTTVTGGLLGIERIGSTAVNAVLIGQTLSFAAPGATIVGGFFAGLGFDYRLNHQVGLFAGAEATVMTDKSVMGTVRGGARYSF